MKIVFKEWLKCRKACVFLILWLVISIISVILNNSMVLLVSNVFSDIENWEHHVNNIIVASLATIICSMIIGYTKVSATTHCYTELVNQYVDKIIDADYNMFTKFSVSRIAIIQEFIQTIARLGISFGSFIIRMFSISLTLYTMYLIGGLMIIPIILIYGIGIVVFKKIFKMYMHIDDNFQKIRKSRNQEIENIINGFAEVRSFGTSTAHKESIHNKNYESLKNRMKKSKTNSILYGAIDTVEGSAMVLTVLYTVKKVINGLITQAEAMSLIMYIFRIIEPLLAMLDFVDELSENLSLSTEYKSIIDYQNKQSDGQIVINSFNKSIELDDVTFSYDDTTNAVNHINMKIHKGQKIGICGVSGGGKSTLFKLINRFYDVNHGEIKIDGFNIQDLTLDSYRKLIGSVHQENVMFPGSIKENITYGSPYATEYEIIEACKKAHIYDFITSLEKRFDTEVGPRGLKLSGGQKQRIALARLFLRNPEIILLDEATSALDNESETIIQDAIDGLKDKTIITIAHRLSTIKNCDIIYVIGENGVIEQGDHAELVEKHGVYYSMLK